MSSPLTKAKQPQRWPRNANAARIDAIEAAREARKLLAEARRILRANPLLAEVQIADAATLLADIERVLGLARIGVEPTEDEG